MTPLQVQGPAAMDRTVELLTKAGELLGVEARNIEDMQRHGKKFREPSADQFRCGNTLIVLDTVAALDVSFLVRNDGTPSYWVTSDFWFKTEGRMADHMEMLRIAHTASVTRVEHDVRRKADEVKVATVARWETEGPDFAPLLQPHVEFLHLCLAIRAKA